jgi:beta-lactamase class D
MLAPHAVLCAAFAACAPPAPAPREATPPDTVIDLSDIFQSYEAEGTFVLLDVGEGRLYRHNPDRAATRYTPASTFKVYNAMVALENGVVAPALDSMQFDWDGTQRRVPGWNEDQSLRTSMERSTVWVYQEIARRVGADRYVETFAREPYGNGDISCGLDVFWLENCLAISADEQVRFIDRLRRGDVAFRPEVQAAVRDLIRLEATSDHVLFGKTGWGLPEDGSDLGWLVGWIEPSGRAPAVFALNITPAGSGFDMMAARRGILFGALDRLGYRRPRAGDPVPTAIPPPDARGARAAPPPDEWIARDKALHLGVSFLMTLASQYVLERRAEMDDEEALPLSAGFTLAVGLGKEVADSQRTRAPAFSWRDLVADAVGVALAALVIVL